VQGAECRARSAGVITVRVSDHRAIDGQPWIDVEIAGFAVEALLGGTQRILSWHQDFFCLRSMKRDGPPTSVNPYFS
jgi:hypothetical protein